ncbi:MAG: hypothetical protein NXI31_25185 [bacterium]|nr:hypothetical protein [bacterium]
MTDQPARPTRPTRSALLAAAARELAELTHSATPDPARRDSLQQLARRLREATAASLPPAGRPDARQALAIASSAPDRPPAERDLSDLRLFARLRISECSELLGLDPAEGKRHWQRIHTDLFAAARRRIERADDPTMDSEGSEL